MKKDSFRLLSVLTLTSVAAIAVTACQKTPSGSSGGGAGGSTSSIIHNQGEVDQYMSGLKESSEKDHLYLHYLRKDNTPDSYSNWDIWAWPYSPKAGEGYRFNFAGRTTDLSSATLEASGSAVVESFGGAYVDIDLTKTYDGGWDNIKQKIGGTSTNFYSSGTTLDEKIGFEVVKSESRTSSSGFWKNDGGNVYVTLADYALAGSKGTSYHVFFNEDSVQSSLAATPAVSVVDPFKDDDGTNVTYGDAKYSNADWTDKKIMATSPKFLKGDTASSYLKNGAGVGYQIMVSSFADSDGDGNGDIYGIDQKLDYISSLGVNVLWLTPIQLSDSYHGYDISDYTQVDPKFGSSVSPNAKGGEVDSASAMEDYKLLLKDAHEKGMAVIMDLVLNHTSITNKWFVSSAQLDEEKRGYYQWGNNSTDAANINEGKFWYPYGDHVYSYYAKFGSAMPELNYAYKSTREAVSSMAKTWLSLGVDGFRMDAVKHIFLEDEVTSSKGDSIIKDVSDSGNYSSNLTKNINFWRELAYDVKSDYPDCFFVGENFDGSAYQVAPYYEGFDSLFDFYSYFNLTSAAANARTPSIGGGVTAFDGYTSGSTYGADGITNASTSVKYLSDSKWDLANVMNVNNRYRTGGTGVSSGGYSFINGAFTSNHDIARCINRVAGTGDNTGIQAQGTITSSNYSTMLASATCVEIAEFMLPGCTWIYYGDELGMTGNFASGQNSLSSYADLAYRQPMKWVDGGTVGDGSYTTGYSITGSGTGVKLDAINSSSAVASVATSSSNTHFKAIQSFAKLKSSTPALIRGTYDAYGWDLNGSAVNHVFNVKRTLGADSYNIVVNFSPSVSLSAGFTGTLAASYNGGTLTSLPPLSAIAVKN